MNRLTERTSNGVAYMAIADSLPKRDQELEGSKPILEGLYAMFQKLAEYEDLEEQGLLIKLPCKVGTELFHVRTEVYADGYSVEYKEVIKEIELTNHNIFEIKRNWNKTVFLTREEAEKALEESEAQNDL